MEQHDYIVLLEKFFKKEASSEERRILIEWIRKPGIRNEFNLLCEQMWKEAAVEIDKTVEEEMWNHLQRNLDEPKILSPKKRRWQPIIYKVAATILLPVCLGLATYFGVEHMNKVSQDPFHGGCRLWTESESDFARWNESLVKFGYSSFL